MAKMSRQTKLMFIAVTFISIVQNPLMAATPAIDLIHTEVFPTYSLSTIQSVTQSSFFILVFSSVLSAFLVSRNYMTKKGSIVFGLLIQSLAAVTAIFLHTKFWHFVMYNVLFGIAFGIYVPNTLSSMIDFFHGDERNLISGMHEIGFCGGGIIYSLLGGVIAAWLWYGCYILALLGLPCAIYCHIVMPGSLLPGREKKMFPKPEKRSPLPPALWYFAAYIFLNSLMYNACGTNLSTHIAQVGIGGSKVAGTANAVMLVGGITSGIIFNRLQHRFGDHVMEISYILMMAGFLFLGFSGGSIILIYIGCFCAGMANSLALPMTIIAESRLVDETNSSLATTIVNCVIGSLGSFMAPVVITNITQLMFGDSTSSRYLFTAGLALVFVIIVGIINFRRDKKSASNA